jgi:dephospho-CoA kinase
MKRLRRIGIAGYMGAGKSTAARLLAGDGSIIITADREAKSLMQGSPAICGRLAEAFGAAVIEEGTIRFDRLGAAAFASAASLQRLNEIVHPPLVATLEKLLAADNARGVILDAALLPCWRFDAPFDACLWIEAPFEMRLHRLLAARPDLDEPGIAARMRLQEQMLPEPFGDPSWTGIDNSESPEHLARLLSAF